MSLKVAVIGGGSTYTPELIDGLAGDFEPQELVSEYRSDLRELLEAKLRGMGKDVTLTIHPGTGHAFMAPHNALGTRNDAVAKQIWPEVVSFLKTTLA